MKFEEYFSFEAIVGDLVKWRIAGKDVGGTLPPRKMWSRAGVKERKGVAPDVVRRQAIWRTVRRACGDGGECCQCGNVASSNVASFQLRSRQARPLPLRWVRNLMRLVEEVQGVVFSGKVAFEAPKMFKIAKGREGGVMQYREVASFERLADRVILSRMTAYVRDRLEGVLSDRCYSFRRDRNVTAKVKDCDMCWAGAFPNVTDCAETKMQMRRLDRVREGMLAKVVSMLPARHFMTGHRYKGRPFSYYGFLEKAVRPTNMARQTQIHILPYSEL